MDNPIKKLFLVLKEEKKDISSIYFYAIFSGLLQLSVPVGVQAIIGFVLGANMVVSIYVLIFLVVSAVLVVGIMQINQMKIIEKIQQSIFVKYAFDFAEVIPRMNLKSIDNVYLPEKVNRFFDCLNLQKGISKLLLDIPTASIQILFGLILLSLYHPIFILFGSVLLIILYVILKFTSKQGLITSLMESKNKYKVVSWLEEMARVIKSFKFTMGSNLNLIKTDEYVTKYLETRTKHFNVLVFQYRSLVVFKVAITFAMLFVGAYLLVEQKINIGEFIAAEIVILTVIGAVEKFINSLDSVYDVLTGIEKLSTVVDSELEHDGNIEFNTQNKGVLVEFQSVGFQYQPEQFALKNINFSINSGTINIISGEDGSGKSSVLKLLTGNYSDFTGNILFNHLPINNFNLQSLRSSIGTYNNDQDIFEGTIFENISMYRKNVTEEGIVKLANELGMGLIFNQMPFGFNTKLDPNGKKLSSILSKKILLLRALCHSPNLLLLEDSWLLLDETTKQKIYKHLNSIKQTTTIVIASNNKDLLDLADQVIHLNQGEIKKVKP